jgi:hypothetical protein
MHKLLTLAQTASELERSEKWLRDWLAKNPKDDRGIPFYLPIGRNKMFEPSDIARIKAYLAAGFEERTESVIYFLAVRGFIKIGWTSDWRRRFANLQCANPEPLQVLLIIGRPQVYEKTMHTTFAAHRTSGEWFSDHTDIRSHIAKHESECWFRAGRYK